MYQRHCKLSKNLSFFLFGPRGTGKSSLLSEAHQPNKSCIWFDLLDEELFLHLSTNPRLFYDQLSKHKGWVVVDEVQRIPGLLNYVQKLIEEKNIKFALTGSSARKLKRNSVNLLGGRAVEYSLSSLTSSELGSDFNLTEALNYGTLPLVCNLDSPEEKKLVLQSYVNTYIKQEIREEQIVRKLDPFLRFLEVAAQMNGKILNINKIAQEVGTDSKSIVRYYEILEDTLLGFLLEPFHESIRKRQSQRSKFYFFDLGVKRAIERNLTSSLSARTSAFGEAFEHFIINEMLALSRCFNREDQFYYLATKDDLEIDLIIKRNKNYYAFEIKSSAQISDVEIKKYQKIREDFKFKEFIFISQESKPREFLGFKILPWNQALELMYPDSLKK